jgi:glycosyltransferase involved in cell wall biosynthesis
VDGGHRPLVSLVTAVRNGAGTLERTLRSVREQTYGPIEHVVIDGGSTDGTLEVIRRHEDRIAHWVSEPDRGIADAFNKGVAAAKGELIGLINADDWLGPTQIEHAVGALARTGADFAFGDLLYHGPAGEIRHRIKGDAAYARVIGRGMPDVNHPTLLARRAVFEAVGGFDPGLRVAMDYDWLLRAHRLGFRGVYEPRVVAHMRLAGTSDERWREGFAEVREVSIRHGLPAHRAWALYFWRVAKGSGRRVLERLAPQAVHDALRRRLNRGFRPLPGP